MTLKRDWWKMLSGFLLLYAVIAGFLVDGPDDPVNQETFRNIFFHVGMWFAMFAMLTTGFIFSLRYLRTFNPKEDLVAVEAVNTGLLFGFLGLVTGMIWGNYTWMTPWAADPKLIGAAAGMLIYLGYVILRSSVEDVHKRARVSGVFNVLAYFMWIAFVLIQPRLGREGVHVKNVEGMSLPLAIVFFPAMAGWTLLAFWIMSISVRLRKIRMRLENS